MFLFETGRVLSIQKPSGIYTYSQNAEPKQVYIVKMINFLTVFILIFFYLFKIKISLQFLKINKI